MRIFTITQSEVNQLVADATGEDVNEIRHRGFSMADPMHVNFDPEPEDLPSLIVDWDEMDLQRNVAVVSQRQCVRVA